MTDFHPELASARWLPRFVFPQRLRPVYRLVEWLQGWRRGERVVLRAQSERGQNGCAIQGLQAHPPVSIRGREHGRRESERREFTSAATSTVLPHAP